MKVLNRIAIITSLNSVGNKLMLLSLTLTLIACGGSVQNVRTIGMDDAQMFLCNESEVTRVKELKLSELVEDFQIIRMDNRKEAFFGYEWMFFSNNHICIRQSQGPVKLFDKSGKFIADVGKIGRGPGEYTSIYDVLIDEAANSIYVSPISGDAILQYDFNGKFKKEINLGARLNKARLFMQPDSTLSVVHLCFKDRGDQFSVANIRQNDSIEHLYIDALAINSVRIIDGREVSEGFNNEVWAYRNTPEATFMMTYTDTLYQYNPSKNSASATFAMEMDEHKRENNFTIYQELPNHYLAHIIGDDGRRILIDKDKQEAYEANITNDYLGGMDIGLKFQDGYFFSSYEPLVLDEKITEHLASTGGLTDEQIEKLKALKSTLNEEDNNILFIGKLKK